MSVPVGIVGWGTYFPQTIETAAQIAPIADIPEQILIDKMGIRQRHVAGTETVMEMAAEAGKKALQIAGVDAQELDLIVSHGSEHKDHLVWVGANKIQNILGAHSAYAFDVSAVCAGAPIAMDAVRGMMQINDDIEYALLAVGTRERELINLGNERSRFMFNFADGAGAMLLKRNADQNLVLGTAAITDGTLSHTVILTDEAAGDDNPIVGDVHGRLDVTDLPYMRERLAAVTLDNFVTVIRRAAEKAGASLADVDFFGCTHVKRSFYLDLLDAIGLGPEQSVYLENFGHVQSADQVISLEQGLAQGRIKPGDLVILAGAGAGYTWSAVAIRWG